MDIPYITIPTDQAHFLVKGDYIRYMKRGDDKVKKGFVICHWQKEGASGLCLGFSLKKGGKKWSVSYDTLEAIEKKINPAIFFEYQFLSNMIRH